eukprot:CAMPEP_0119369464 /NCGR_PEP_ID=MMETSP1334-20130426/15972_1 /TAXON_ID=127549 /ORGANISM="Calcidiscus leptoporus, Strain RCC1130" /LENGTH=62 /DNA_ID=CAMNT_0007386309 /DNA_START=33 /DNA_END=218 /DNA_ORIENTATION=+
MTEAEVRAAAHSERLTLVKADNATGFHCVYRRGSSFSATALGDRTKKLGHFHTALEAALHVA